MMKPAMMPRTKLNRAVGDNENWILPRTSLEPLQTCTISQAPEEKLQKQAFLPQTSLEPVQQPASPKTLEEKLQEQVVQIVEKILRDREQSMLLHWRWLEADVQDVQARLTECEAQLRNTQNRSLTLSMEYLQERIAKCEGTLLHARAVGEESQTMKDSDCVKAERMAVETVKNSEWADAENVEVLRGRRSCGGKLGDALSTTTQAIHLRSRSTTPTEGSQELDRSFAFTAMEERLEILEGTLMHLVQAAGRSIDGRINEIINEDIAADVPDCTEAEAAKLKNSQADVDIDRDSCKGVVRGDIGDEHEPTQKQVEGEKIVQDDVENHIMFLESFFAERKKRNTDLDSTYSGA